MRIWSVHAKYLDTKGLLAVWRESLLAKKVLEGNTKGYKNHPQLNRFRAVNHPLDAINHYLSEIYKEAQARKYCFDKTKITDGFQPVSLHVTKGQLQYEMAHLLRKLAVRDLERFRQYQHIQIIEPVPLFEIVEGDVEPWEVQTV